MLRQYVRVVGGSGRLLHSLSEHLSLLLLYAIPMYPSLQIVACLPIVELLDVDIELLNVYYFGLLVLCCLILLGLMIIIASTSYIWIEVVLP